MSHAARKPVFQVSNQVRHEQSCMATEDGYRLEVSDLGSKGIVFYVAKTKVLSYKPHREIY